jgi:Predicted metal-dependent hydrolase of the TIM-barrel fold
LKESPSSFAKKFYYDTITFDAVCLEFAVARLGADRFMLGSDYPFDMSDPEPARIVDESHLTKDERTAILSGNVQRLIGKAAK